MFALTAYREEAIRRAIAGREGELVPRAGWTKPAFGVARVRGGHARLDGFYSNKVQYSRVIAPVAMRVGPVCWIARQNVFGRIAKTLRLVHDVELGGGTELDVEFDRRFLVKCQRVEESARMWTPTARRLALDFLGRMELFRAGYASVGCDGNMVRFIWPETDLSFLARASKNLGGEYGIALAIVDELSSFGTDILDRLRALPDGRYREPSPASEDPVPPQVELDTAYGLARIWPAWQPWGLALAVSQASTRGLPPFAFEIEPGAVISDTKHTDVLAPAAIEELRGLGHATLVSDGIDVRLFVGARLEPDRLLSATRAVGLLASGATSSAFR